MAGHEDAHLTVREVEQIAQRSAHLAIRETFRLLGADLEDQDSVNELRSDLVHARKVRRASASLAGKAGLTFVGLTVVGASIAAWEGLKNLMAG